MIKTIDDFRHKLITKILFATSQDEVGRYCISSIRELETRQVYHQFIVRFLEKTITELANFSPRDQNSQQWSNIINAKVFCKRLIEQYSFYHE
jgi:hypothetical protein